MNILVVEDSVDIALLIELQLKRAGHSVDTWTSAFASIAQLAPWDEIDVVIADQELDDYDGKELFRWLEVHQPSVRRVMNTGSSLVNEEEASAHAVLIKPVNTEAILASIKVPT